jgi:hypothetical protein
MEAPKKNKISARLPTREKKELGKKGQHLQQARVLSGRPPINWL